MSTLKVNTINAATSGQAVAVDVQNPKSFRNLIINGAMQVAQRAATSNTAAAGTFTLDRWKLEHANTNEAPNITQHTLTSSDTGPWAKGFRHSLHIENGNQTSGADTNDYMIVMQNIEAQNMATSGWDYTSASSYITLSYWVRSSVSQNFYHYLRGRDGTEQMYAWETGTLSANTWTKITKTIPGNANLQFDNNNGEGLRLTIPLYWGGNWTNNNSLDTWANYDSSNRTPDWASTWYTTNNATFEFTGVQLEVGSYATDFEHRSYAEELVRCERYFKQFPASNSDGYTPIANGYCSSTSRMQCCLTFNPMRAIPTVTFTGNFRILHGDEAHTVNSHDSTNDGNNTVLLRMDNSAGSLNKRSGGVVTQNNDSSAKVMLAAEL